MGILSVYPNSSTPQITKGIGTSPCPDSGKSQAEVYRTTDVWHALALKAVICCRAPETQARIQTPLPATSPLYTSDRNKSVSSKNSCLEQPKSRGLGQKRAKRQKKAPQRDRQPMFVFIQLLHNSSTLARKWKSV